MEQAERFPLREAASLSLQPEPTHPEKHSKNKKHAAAADAFEQNPANKTTDC